VLECFMEELSKTARYAILAYEKGYRVLSDGSVRGITKILKILFRL